MKIALIILNGISPSQHLLFDLWQKTDFHICADGGANILAQYQLEPDYIVGDLDSISQETKNSFQHLPKKIINDPYDYRTDGEKAVQFCLNQGYKKIYILGADGNRTDHFLYNLGILRKFHTQAKIAIFTNHEKLFVVQQQGIFFGKKGQTISFMPIFGDIKNVQTQGLLYPVEGKDFELGMFTSISNVFEEEKASIQFQDGLLLVCQEFPFN
ncbi:MAG: thiamine pyrophosphokinase [bacterium]|jgi:thiamine pyrophosphokinase